MVTGLQLAPLYDTLGKKTVEYVLNQTNVATLCLSKDHIPLIQELKTAGKLKNLKTLILMDSHDKSLVTSA